MKVILEWLQKRWVYHSISWIAVGTVVGVFIWYIPDFTEFSSLTKYALMPYAMSELLMVVYGNFYLVGRFYKKGSRWKYFISLAPFVVSAYYLDKLFVWLFFDSISHLIALDYSEIFQMIIGSVLVRYFKRGITNQYQFTELKAKTAEMELNSLKAQINPHFLFNNLNNIYAINQIDSEKGSEMILELADVMRYHLQFSKQERVSLSDEIQLIKSYIELEKLRLNGNCDLQIDIREGEGNPFIAPLLLLPFIENAFKHGTHPKENCFVHLRLFMEKRRLHFEISNSIILNKKVVKTNIGFSNTKKRLELLYPEKHLLEITQHENEYLVKVEIGL